MPLTIFAQKPAVTERPTRARKSLFGKSRNARHASGRGQGLTFGERLIRNSAVACALLLTVMALRNLNKPWSNQVTDSIRSVVTMRLDWDQGLGKLSFVRALVPDAALVFLNLGDNAMNSPVEGTVKHGWSGGQPWIEFSCAPGSTVQCVREGVVKAVGQGAAGDWIVLVSHEEGESLYGYMQGVQAEVGQSIAQGAVIGTSGERLYFEWREDGEPVDPTDRLGI